MLTMMRSQEAVNEREARGFRTFGNAVIPGNIVPNVGEVTFIQGTHRTSLNSDLQGRTNFGWYPPSAAVASTVVVGNSVLIRQESPHYSQQRFGNAVIPGNVAYLPQVGSISTKQEFPYHPSSILSSFTASVAAPNVVENSLQIPPLQQEVAYHPLPRLVNAVIPGSVAYLPQVGSIILKQEQPDHPKPWLTTPLIQGNVAYLPQVGRLLTIQEQPSHPGPRLTTPLISGNVAYLPQVGAINTKQELPSQPQPILFRGPVTTISGATSFPVIAAQIQPWHPSSVLLSNAIYPPTMFMDFIFVDAEQPPSISAVFAPSTINPPITISAEYRRVFTTRELPGHPPSLALSSVISGNVAYLPQVGRLLTMQEQPYHPASRFGNSLPQLSTIMSAEYRTLITNQEQPFHPVSKLFIGVPAISLVTLSPELRRLFTTQELPHHPGSKFVGSVIPGNVAYLPQVGRLLTIQEMPPQPPPILLPSFKVAPPVPPVGRTVITQEQPSHPGARLTAGVSPSSIIQTAGPGILTIRAEYPLYSPLCFIFGVQGPDSPLLLQPLVMKQEIPPRSSPIVQSGGAFAAPSVTSLLQSPLVTKQERPGDWQSILVSNVSYVSPSAFMAAIFMDAEQPPQLSPILGSMLIKPPPPVPPVGRTINVQELPYHPASQSWVFPAKPPPVPPVGRAINAQEMPFHPISQFWVFPAKPNPVPPVGRAINSQEWPYHPGPQFWSSSPVAAPAFMAMINQLYEAQEYPWHPTPILSSGYLSPFIAPLPNQARILQNVKVRVRILMNKNPRTIRYN